MNTRYKDLAEKSYVTEWTLDPLLCEGSGIQNFLGINDLVAAVEEIPRDPSAPAAKWAAPRGREPQSMTRQPERQGERVPDAHHAEQLDH